MPNEALPKMVTKKVFDATASDLAKAKKRLANLQAENRELARQLVEMAARHCSLSASYDQLVALGEARTLMEAAGIDRDQGDRFLSVFRCVDADTTLALAHCIAEMASSRREDLTTQAG